MEHVPTGIDCRWGSKIICKLGPVACTSCNKIDVGGGTVTNNPWLGSTPGLRCSGAFLWVMFVPAISHETNN